MTAREDLEARVRGCVTGAAKSGRGLLATIGMIRSVVPGALIELRATAIAVSAIIAGEAVDVCISTAGAE